jgi:hypothetical protein
MQATTLSSEKANMESTVISDCRVMLHYALGQGISLESDLRKAVSIIDLHLVKLNDDPLSPIPRSLVGTRPEEAKNDSQGQPITFSTELLLDVHSQLSTRLSPITPVSLRATKSEIGYLRRLVELPLALKIGAAGAILGIVGFCITTPTVNVEQRLQSALLATMDQEEDDLLSKYTAEALSSTPFERVRNQVIIKVQNKVSNVVETTLNGYESPLNGLTNKYSNKIKSKR